MKSNRTQYSPEILNLYQMNKENRKDFHSSSSYIRDYNDVEGPPTVKRHMMETDFLF